ncbi:MAG TPA: type I restriction endonuclease subunit R [Anaerolineae bacterium]|nr:type I restriction endonuclease subunit R [Anaerolineae bacterium]
MSNEYTQVERPFIEQLRQLGWSYLEGDVDVPYLTERESFRQVLLTGRLREALACINLDESGEPWLDETRVAQAVGRLERPGKPRLIEANQVATDLLLKGTPVEGPDGRHVTVRYVDFEHPERNDFLAVNQFRADPRWATAGRDYVVPDLVLFVNGIPLVVVEAKRPDLEDPLTQAITQLLRYSNQREEVAEPEGAERLFHYAQLMVATCFETARVGTVGASYEHYLEWKDTHPVPTAQVAEELGVPGDECLAGQQMLVAGMLRPTHLLDIVRNFTLFTEVGGRTVKIVPRYQQFRAVHKAIERLTHGQTRQKLALSPSTLLGVDSVEGPGEADQRGGIIWHTQGSGKSLTMVFLVRKMRTLPELRRFKVVAVTDRVKLEKQLRDTATLTGEPLQVARSVAEFQRLLRQPGAGLVFGMIQKASDQSAIGQRPRFEQGAVSFPVFNASEEILLLIDEAHRSHTSTLHANLMAALPNCAKIGFTGTPIIEAHKRPTHEIFGPFIDVYTIRQSQQDGATVRILYEGRTTPGEVADGETLDGLFEDMFRERTPQELEAIKARYATTGDVLEAEKLIAAKARDMLRHYVTTVLPDGYKAQVVAVSRLAAVRYQRAFVEAQRELVAELEALAAADEQARRASPLRGALPCLDRVRRLKFATVISPYHNDPPSWRPWTRQGLQDAAVEDFKKAFDPEKDEGTTAMLIVKSMLLTGFDAPVEQVMYLDRPARGYELLQAIARVNRTYGTKACGLVVDYYGLAHHLKAALDLYAEGDVEGALRSIRDELPLLADRHQRAVSLFTARGCDLQDTAACVDLLYDARLRALFVIHLREFLQTLNTVLPRPEALPYVPDARHLGLIRARAFKRYRDQHLNIAGAEAKVRRLIDEYVVAQGIDTKVPPIDILAADFEEHVGRIRSPRAQAAEMEFAARHHIRRHFQEDPVYYQKLSQRLEEILQTFAENWEAQVRALRAFIREYRAAHADVSREDRAMQPFLRLLVEASPRGRPTGEERARLAAVTVEMVDQIRGEISRVDFWRNVVAQEQLRGRIVQYLDVHDLAPFDEQELLADQIVQTARANHTLLVEQEA